ncbi:MAG: hypothetical protein UY72_C0072G0004 [Candidatus Uhrbacteria bacterium GW2011_GWD2_52_7]|uniref:Uncharacterized protein n=1 Tax=Candidatus Uhrbacteria bacterium GW2011_GWD2_52_7 TaxID=1618989 RepID=A0A0G2A7Z4_9BACT|nr:MAG: hypothetical protein UY72_C0072G0004 [Candidatus Uhrbacteria bacterium GW2011_GWD2_52_7]
MLIRLIVMFLAGCGTWVACPEDEFCRETELPDVDVDGYSSAYYTSNPDELDCNDFDALTFPRAPLVCPPGDTTSYTFDRNCNGTPDVEECARYDTGR